MKQAIDFLTGKLGSFGDSAAQFAKNISVDGLQKSWDTYMVQSPEELANVARETMKRNNTVISNLNMNAFDNAYAAADKSNAEYVTELNKLKGTINAGNMDEATNIAKNISERFQDGEYLKLLQEAEEKTNSFNSIIDSRDSDVIRRIKINDAKQKISENKLANQFLKDKDQEKLAEGAYKLQGLKQYYNSGDAKTNQVRMAVTGGGYLGGSMVVRGLQGGNPITNEYGERDIAGIPFI